MFVKTGGTDGVLPLGAEPRSPTSQSPFRSLQQATESLRGTCLFLHSSKRMS